MTAKLCHRTTFQYAVKERPDIAEQLYIPQWFYDRKGEVSEGLNEWMRTLRYYYHSRKLSIKWDLYYVGALQRFWEKDLLLEYSDKQTEVLFVVEGMCQRLCLEMTLQIGDIQLVTNTNNLHAEIGIQGRCRPKPEEMVAEAVACNFGS